MALKSRVLLVYPSIARAERYRGSLGVFGGKQIPLGLFYLAAYLRRHGCPVNAIDAEAQGLADGAIVAHLRRGNFDVIGISATTAVFHRAAALARIVKAALPRVTVVIGGPHVSSQPLESMACEAFDYAIPREGEETLRETVQALENGSGLASVKGLVYREGGRVLSNAARPYIEDLDSLPVPAYDLIPDIGAYHPPPFNYRRRPVANVMTSRGCPNQCTFCSNATFGRRLRLRSAESVVEEIEMLLRRFHVREIAFSDDSFTIQPRRVYEIFDLAARRGLRFPWTCRSRVNAVDEPLLRYMKAHGCWYVAFGIESGDEEILREIRKDITLAQVERAVELSHRIGLVTKGFFIVGHPRESLVTIERTVRFATRLKLDQVAVMMNTPLPGTHQYRHAEEYGHLGGASWSDFTFWQPVFVPRGLTRKQLLAKHREFLARFYLRPGWLLRELRKVLVHPGMAVQFWHIALDFIRLAGAARARRAA